MNSNENPSSRLLSDAPAKTDAFGAHERIAELIARYVRSDHPGITIGLVGPWGSGKSTVLRLLRAKLSQTNSSVFLFDAWAHEGDSLRRSFLEQLIDGLVDEQWIDKSKWEGKKDELARRKRDEKSTVTPKLTSLGHALAVALLLVPVGIGMIEMGAHWTVTLLGLLLTTAPLIVVGVIIAALRNKTWVPEKIRRWVQASRDPDQSESALWSVLVNSKSTETRTLTVETPEPTSVEFQTYFQELLKDALAGNSNRLVLVVDNLDRISIEHASEIWSTLQTFLHVVQKDEPEWMNRLWLLVPYDRRGLTRVWTHSASSNEVLNSQDSTEPSSPTDSEDSTASSQQRALVNEELAESFLERTFQVRLEVPPPLLSRWRSFLLDRLEESFGTEFHDEFETVYRVYDRFMLRATPTPRSITVFVNQVSSTWSLWDTDIPLSHVAYYVLVRQGETDVSSLLVSGSLPYPRIVDMLGENLMENLAAMSTGRDIDEALQIIIEPRINSALSSGNGSELANLANRSEGFWAVLERLLSELPERWNATDVERVSNAAISIRDGMILDLVVGIPHERAVRELVKRLAFHISSWAPLNHEALRGFVAMNQLLRDEEFAHRFLASIAIPNHPVVEPEEAVEWAQRLIEVLESIDEVGLSTVYDNGIHVPLEPGGFISACAEVLGYESREHHRSAFRLEETSSVIDYLSQRVREYDIDQSLSNARKVLEASGTDVDWTVLWKSIEEVLREVSEAAIGDDLSVNDEMVSTLLEHLNILARGDSNADELLQAMGDDGTSIAICGHFDSMWALYTYLRYGHRQSSKSPSPQEARGFEKVEELYQNPADSQVKELVDLTREMSDNTTMFSVRRSTDRAKPLFRAWVGRVIDLGLEDQLLPHNVVFSEWCRILESLARGKDWQPVHAFLSDEPRAEALVERLIATEIGPSNYGLCAALIHEHESKYPALVDWILRQLRDINAEDWQNAFIKENNLLLLLVNLSQSGITLELGSAYLDAMEGVSFKMRINQLRLRRFADSWPVFLNVMDCSGLRSTFRNRLVDVALKSSTVPPRHFFDLLGDELKHHDVQTNRLGYADRFLSRMIRDKNIAGLDWMESWLTESTKSIDQLIYPDEIAIIRDVIRRTITDTKIRNTAVQRLERIAKLMGIESEENRGGTG